MTAAYIEPTPTGLGLGRPDHEPLAGETIGPIVALIAALIEQRQRLRRRRRRLLPRAQRRALRRALAPLGRRRWTRGRASRAPSARRTRWTSRSGRRTRRARTPSWDAPWGRGRPGWHIECSAMAEELLGVGFDIHGGGNDLVFPHHENEAAQTRMARGAELAQIWMHNGMLQMGEEKMAKSVGNIALLGDVLAQWGRDARDPVLRQRPLPPAAALLATRRWRRRRRSVRRIREAGRRLVAGPSPEDLRRPPRALLRRAGRRLQHAARAGRASSSGSREANKREAVGRRGPARDARRARARQPARRAGRRRPGRRGARAARRARGRRAPARTGRAPTGSATSSRRSAGRSATGPSGADARALVILYGRNAVHEALRGRRAGRCTRSGRPASAAREPWLRRRGRDRSSAATSSSAAAGSEAHQGVCANVGAVPVRRRRRAARRGRTR